MVAVAEWGQERRGPHGERLGIHGQQLRACGAVRVSTRGQTTGHSPEVQREGIITAAAQYGYLLDPTHDIYEDTARGHVLKRPGYQAIMRGIEDGRYQACLVFMFDRLGRSSVERVARAHDWDRRGVALISVMEGVDQPGVLRMVRIGMAEEESRRIAARTIPNRLKGAQMGNHQGRTPYGYVRLYPQTLGQRKVAGLLVPDPTTSLIVVEMFERYATGHWSSRLLADDLNTRQVPPPKPLDDEGRPRLWTTGSVHAILTNQTYAAAVDDPEHGTIEYGRRKVGYYQTTAGLHVGAGQHVPLIDRALFEQVQQRLAAARCCRGAQAGPRQHRVVWLAGRVRCADCGGRMIPSLVRSHAGKNGEHGKLWCSERYHGRTPCQGRSYRLDLAEQGLLDQVRRLRGSPWSVDGERLLSGDQGAAAQALQQELDEARETLRQATKRFMFELKQPTDLDREMFELVRSEKGQRIADLEHQLASLKQDAQDMPRLKALHARLTQTEVRALVDGFLKHGDHVALRDLVTAVVDHATLVERVPTTRSRWLRFEVCWTADVDKLLSAGLLWLADDVERPA